MPGAPLIVPSASATGTGTTFRRYWQLLGEQLGTYAEYVVSTTASTGEAARLVLIDELRDDEEARDSWGGGYVYPIADPDTTPQAGQQRRVLKEGYEGPAGALVLSRPWSAAIAAGTVVALSEPLPVSEYLGVKGLKDLVNEALARIWIEARITLTGTGGYDYSLASYDWLLRTNQLRGIYDFRALGTSNPSQPTRVGYDLIQNGVTRTLLLDTIYATSETFELAVSVRADRLVYDGASWAYAADPPGLVNDDDQAAAPAESVVAIGMVKALQEQIKRVRRDRTLSPQEKAALIDGPGGLTQRKRPWLVAAHDAIMIEGPERGQDRGGGFMGEDETDDIGWTRQAPLSVPLVP